MVSKFTPLADQPALSFFGDASSQERAYMVAGGLAVAGARIAEIEDHIALLRDDAGIRSEFHWSDYRGGRRQAGYEALIRYGFGLVTSRKAALHIIIAKFSDYDHRRDRNENRQTSVNRMYYQLLLHRIARFYGSRRAIHVRLDAGNDSADICKMRNELCADAYKKYSTKPNCIKSIEPVQSTNVGLVQLADVILGAVAAKRNAIAHQSAKGDLADFVLKSSGRHSWDVNTSPSARFLTVWQHATRARVP